MEDILGFSGDHTVYTQFQSSSIYISPSVISTHMIASGSVLQTPALVQVMVLGPVNESPLSHW